MNYDEAATFLFDLRRFRMTPGTESTAAFLSSLGDPHEGPLYVQVAGSNGKGSTARMVERILRDAGLSVGLYTSPHLDDVRERIRIDGRKMPKSAVCEFVAEAREFVVERGADGVPPTFFETLTTMALWQFGREDVDVAVLEVGIGGRYDATSVVDPVASAVTSVSLEHTKMLGDTVEEIARDKAHVAPADRPLVTATTGDALAAVRERAGDVITVGSDDTDVVASYGGRTNHAEAAVAIEAPDWPVGGAGRAETGGWRVETRIPTLGAHQARNAAIAAALARQVGDAVRSGAGGHDLAGRFGGVDETTLARGLRNAHWPGRFEVVDTEPLVVLDGAHNPGACETLSASLSEFDYGDLHLVFGAMHDKDHRDMVAALPDADSVRTCRPGLDRAADPAVLATVFRRAGVGDVRTCDAVASAAEAAIDGADPGDCVLVTGSLSTVAEARRRYTRTQVPKRIRDLADARDALEDADVSQDDVRRMRGSAVHRVIRTRVQRRQADYLKAALSGIGGECAVSGIDRNDELLDVVLMGTLAEFERLVATLDGKPRGLAWLADDLRTTLGIDTDRGGVRYPWRGDRTAVMGILNITPDSFHDGGEYNAVDDARERAERMVAAGADVLDVGGESTRPGADPVSVEEEIDRVVPVIEAIADLDAVVSVDTRKAAVAEAALEAGADMLNDVSELEDPAMRFLAADYDVPLVVMHSIETPVDPDTSVDYDDVVGDLIDELTEKVLLCEAAGLDREQIVVDPGLGFGKAPVESFELLGRIDEFRALGCPVLAGHSHKSMFGLVGADAGERLAPTVAASAIAADRGVDVLRVHDVPENVAAVRTAAAADDPAAFLDRDR